MNGKHWTDEELLDRLYGVGRRDNHLEACAECDARWNDLVARRRSLQSEPEVSPLFLLRQRMAVMERIEPSKSSFLTWRAVTAVAGACAMALGLVIYRPEQSKTVAVRTVPSDSQFFSEIYSAVEQTEPRAVKPIRRLFEEQQ
jgi:hypothetical protein